MTDTVLRITIANTKPVELMDLTKSFVGFADEYRRFVAKNPENTTVEDVKLYIREIRTGSIVAEVVALTALGLPFIENANSVLEFAGYLKSTISALLEGPTPDSALDKSTYENVSAIMEPVARDSCAQLNLQTVVNGDVHLHFGVSSLEANATQNAARRALAFMKEPATGFHEKVLLYWYQARNDLKSSAGDRGIVESIHRSAVKVVFANETTKAHMILDDENPFRYAYIVDIAVETVVGRPALYKVLSVHEKIEKPSS